MTVRHLIRRLAATAVIGTALAVMALGGAGTASAHAIRVAADPSPDASLGVGPPQVSATFNEKLQTNFAAMAVVGPDGNRWSQDDVGVDGAVVRVELRQPLGPAGKYTVNYRVTSADGHVVTGAWAFELTAAGNGTPGPPVGAPGSVDDGLPVWPFVALAAAIVAAGALMAVRRRA